MSIFLIAKRAGVSIATVSRVLNNSMAVKPETRELVNAAIVELGYRPNLLGRNLRTSESRLLLTMVPDFGNPFYAEIVQGISTVARREGYNVLLCDTNADLPTEHAYFDMVRNRLADGAICLDPEATQRALAEDTSDLCWVACCEFDPGGSIPYVGIDNARAASDAVTYLIVRGRRRIAFLNSDERYLYARERRRGYLDALRGAGLSPPQDGMLDAAGLSFDDGRRAVQRLLQSDARPDAIFAVSDTLAIGAMCALREAGLRVPEDVALIGFDNVPVSSMVQPELTTVAQPMRQLGETAATLLLRRLRDPMAVVEGLLLEHRLVLRDSA